MKPHTPARIPWISLLAVLLVSACSGQASPSATAPAPILAATEAALPSSPEEWKTAILKAFRAQREKSWRYESETVTPDGKTGRTTIEFAPPDRYHIVGEPNTNMIIIGQQVFAQQNKQWTLVNVPASSIIDPQATSRLEQNMHNVQCTSPETLDGKPMHACAYDSTTRIGDSDEPVHTKLWIDAATNLPYQMIVDGAVGSMDSKTGKVTAVKATSTIRYTFDPSIQIEAPQLPQ